MDKQKEQLQKNLVSKILAAANVIANNSVYGTTGFAPYIPIDEIWFEKEQARIKGELREKKLKRILES